MNNGQVTNQQTVTGQQQVQQGNQNPQQNTQQPPQGNLGLPQGNVYQQPNTGYVYQQQPQLQQQQPQQQPRMFTQEEVNSMMAKEKNDGRRAVMKELGLGEDINAAKQAMSGYNQWLASQKTPQQLQAEAIAQATQATNKANQRALRSEAKLSAMVKGVNPSALDDVVTIAMSKVTKDKTFDAVLDEMSKNQAYASFFTNANTNTNPNGANNTNGANGGIGTNNFNGGIGANGANGMNGFNMNGFNMNGMQANTQMGANSTPNTASNTSTGTGTGVASGSNNGAGAGTGATSFGALLAQQSTRTAKSSFFHN